MYPIKKLKNLSKIVPVFPLCFSSVHLIEIAIILKMQPWMQIIAQKTGYKKVVRLSVNWAELRTVCLYAFKWSNTMSSFFFFLVSNLVFPSCLVVWICMGEVLPMPVSLCDCPLQRQVKETWGNGGCFTIYDCEHMQFWNEENRNLNNYSNP